MINQANCLCGNNNKPKSYLITTSLLNAWAYMWNCTENVKECENDTICIEDKKTDAMVKAREDFIKTLNRIPSEPNQYMQMGIEFEDECYKGNTCISPIIEGGSYQIVGMRNITIDKINFLLYGRLDVLKGGIIYDIKRVMRYSPQKYFKSYQHSFYFKLFENKTYKFQYLIFDGKDLHKETYYPDQCCDIVVVIKEFISWLTENDLLQTYLDKWQSKGEN